MKWSQTANTDDEVALELAARIESWQARLSHLGIGHFRIRAIHISDETPSGPDAKASVRVPLHYDDAEFWFTYDYLAEADERDLDETIIHEWLHIAWRDFDHLWDRVETWVPEATYADLEDAVDHEREGLIDRIARSMLKLYTESK